MKTILLSLLLVSSLKLSAQSTWVQRLGYTWGNIYVYQDSVCGVQEAVATPDGYLFLITKINESQTFNLQKIPQNGGVFLLDTLIGTQGSNSETVPGPLRATQDSGCVLLTYYTDYIFITTDSWITKFSSTGTVQWTTNFHHDAVNTWRIGYDVIQSSSGNYYVLLNDSLYIVDSGGSIISGTDAVSGKQMFELPNGDLLVRNDNSIFRTDLSGNISWTYSPIMDSDFVTFSSSAAFICGGSHVTKVDAVTGSPSWTASILALPVSSIDAANDGGVIISKGMKLRWSSCYAMNGSLTKFDSSGNLQWSKTYSFPKYGLSCVKQLPSGKYLTGGTYIACINGYSCGYNPFVATVDDSGNGTLDSTDYLWPGDVDLDDTLRFDQDAILIGIALGTSGTPRENYNFNPFLVEDADLLSDFGTPWPQNFCNGINYRYADRNGDGVIDTTDFTYYHIMLEPIPIWHPKESASSQTNTLPDFALIPQFSSVLPGDTMRFYIVAGGSTPVDAVYDIAWGLSFDPYLLDVSYFKVIPFSSDFGTPGIDMIAYSDYELAYGGVMASIFTRTDHNDVFQLNDTVGVIEFLSNANIYQATDFNIYFIQFGAATACAENVEFNYYAASMMIDPLGTSVENADADPVIYPNPASQGMSVKTFSAGEKTFQITDVTGKKLKSFKSSASVLHIGTEDLENGTYFLKVVEEGTGKLAKFIVQR
ncbi:MAG TPA: T9SS type A sorting domain-containing protein [Chitinophagales bacterium]|nr:T9SS type A sorting domain-containing protein [Chitinophagales bacterium]